MPMSVKDIAQLNNDAGLKSNITPFMPPPPAVCCWVLAACLVVDRTIVVSILYYNLCLRLQTHPHCLHTPHWVVSYRHADSDASVMDRNLKEPPGACLLST